jgi:hypothetical protein
LKTIVWDVDDVLNDLMRTWFEKAWLRDHPECRAVYEDIVENPPHGILGASKAEYFASLDAFRLSKAAEEMEPLPETMRWFKQHGRRFRHMVLTGAPIIASPVSAAWVMRHFGWWIRSYHIVPTSPDRGSAPEYDASKKEFLLWWGKGDIMVDDSPRNLDGAREAGLECVLFPRPWNKGKLTISETLEKLAEL